MIKPLQATLTAFVLLCLAGPVGAQDAVFDDGYLAIQLENEVNGRGGTEPADVNYHPGFRMRFFGAAQGDAVVVRWKQGRRTLAEIRCPLEARYDHFQTTFSQRCWTQDAPELTAHGAVQVEIDLVDDSADTQRTVRTLAVTVGRYWHWDRRVGNRDVHSPRYQVRMDDSMGLSTILMSPPDSGESFGNVYFHFWAALADGNSNYRDASWRCSLNGTRVPELDRGSDVVESTVDVSVDNDQMVGRERTTTHFTYRQMWVKPHMLWDPSGGQSGADAWRYNLSAHPGTYECQLRDAGRMVRTFRFTVTAAGTVDPHPVEAAAGLTFRPGAHFVETGFPTSNPSEFVFNRNAIRAGVGFGRSWPAVPAIRTWLDGLPPAYGSSEPTAPRGAARGRRRR